MAVLPLQPGIIYGPVHSRRLGRSLGVNLLPSDVKLCSFDCIYCQYGRTHVKTCAPEAHHFRSVDEICRAVAAALQRTPDIDAITFSGNGEPTLHPHFPTIVSAVRDLRDALMPHVRLALLSNATTAHHPPIRECLTRLDAPIMKLDAGDPTTLMRINGPAPEVKLAHIIAGLQGVPGLTVQSVLIDGPVSNVRGEPFEAWLAALAEVRPAHVQIYSTDYPVPESGVERVLPYQLKRIAEDVKARTGLPIQALWF